MNPRHIVTFTVAGFRLLCVCLCLTIAWNTTLKHNEKPISPGDLPVIIISYVLSVASFGIQDISTCFKNKRALNFLRLLQSGFEVAMNAAILCSLVYCIVGGHRYFFVQRTSAPLGFIAPDNRTFHINIELQRTDSIQRWTMGELALAYSSSFFIFAIVQYAYKGDVLYDCIHLMWTGKWLEQVEDEDEEDAKDGFVQTANYTLIDV